MVIWLTGLPGAGKTTIAKLLLVKLRAQSRQALLLDGDALREALQHHTYDIDSRKQLALTYARLGKMHSEQGSIAICATVSMFDSVRKWNSDNIKNYLEVYVKVDAEVLQQRNQKGLYTSATTGEATNVHGFDLAALDHAIEEPKNPHLVLENGGEILPEQQITKILKGMKL
jgi:adenylylsulfate kinase-like enzyme